MASITSTTGLISGINTADIINQLIKLDSQQTQLYQTRLDSISAQKTAYNGLVDQLTTIQTSGFALSRPTTFNGTTANSSNSDVLTATTTAGAPVGTYQFQVARLVSSQENVSTGFASTTSLVGAGTITIEAGGGQASSQTLLSQLNGGAGVSRGQFRITDRSGHSTIVDTSNAISLDDVVKKINTSVDISVHASIQQNKLVLTDASGSTLQQLTVADLGSGTSATDLGIAGTTTTNTLTGTDINTLGSTTLLSSINDTRGVGRANNGGADFNIKTKDGSSFDISLATAATIGDVVTAINTVTGSKLTASIDTTTNALKLTDNSSGSASLTVTASNNSTAAKDLGLTVAASSGVVQGQPLLASLDSVLVSSLNGGNGLTLGKIDVTNRNNTTAAIDLSGSTSLQDVLDKINNAGLNLKATLNASGNGIAIADTSAGTGTLSIIDDADGKGTATALGVNQTIDTTKTQINGINLQRQWVSANSQLSDYNGGKAVGQGSFTITSAAGVVKTISIGSNATTLGDVITEINSTNGGVTASINAHGDGLLLTDTSGGAGKLTVANVSGTSATALQIVGTATATTIDGTFEKSITVGATDTLATVQQNITALGWGVKASLISDGSSGAPNRLSLSAINTGVAGQVVIDAGTTNLGLQTLVSAQDAAVFVGGDSSAQPLLVTSSSNTITNVLPGVTLNLNSASSSPVTLSIGRDADSVVKEVQGFVDGFNSVITQISTLTKWDSTTNSGGLLLGDFTTQEIQQNLYDALQTNVSTAGQFHSLADLGISLDDNANITLDENKFRTAFANDPDAVKSLFTQTNTGVGAAISNNLSKLIDPVNGKITLENQTLDTKTQQFQDRIDDLNTLLAQKRLRLETQFANMESILSTLQSQQTSISTLSSSTASK